VDRYSFDVERSHLLLHAGLSRRTPSSRIHPASVPLPLPRRVLHRCASRLSTPSMAFTPTTRARLLLVPARRQARLTTRQASLHATDRSVAPPARAFDAGLRPGPLPDRAASLLPGLLAATRTGLTPAGDDELMFGSGHLIAPPPKRWAHDAVPPVLDMRRFLLECRCVGGTGSRVPPQSGMSTNWG